MRSANSLEKMLMLGKIEGRRRRTRWTMDKMEEKDDRRWHGWKASRTQWTWAWASSRRWWRTGKPGMLQSMESKKSDTTERLNWMWTYCIAQGTLLSVMWQLGWEGSLDENGLLLLFSQCHIFLPFHTVHGVLKARILKWFAIPFSSGPCFVRTLHHDLSVLGGPTRHGSNSLS